MVKLMVTLMAMTLFSGEVSARSASFQCRGFSEDKAVVLNVHLEDTHNPKSVATSVEVDGAQLANFESSDVKLGIVKKTFNAKNSQGDILNGKIMNLGDKRGLIYYLHASSISLTLWNIALDCN